MNSRKRIGIVLGALGIAAVLGGGCASAPAAPAGRAKSGSVLDYFPATPGWTLSYDYASQLNPNESGQRYLIFQNPANGKEISFYYSSANTGGMASCLWGTDGDIIGASDSRENKYSDGAFRYFFLFNLPAEFSDGLEYSAAGADYRVATGAAWKDYPDCLKISFTSPDDFGPPWEKPNLGGTGYFYVARGVGLVHFYFENRSSGKVETFSLAKAPERQAPHHIHGRIQDAAGQPLPNVYVALEAWLGMGWWGKSDSAGNFAFDFYCEQGWFRGGFMLGYDLDGDGVLRDREIQIASNYFNFKTADIDMGTLTAAPPEYVDTEIIEYAGHHYQIVMQKLSWQEAESYCRNLAYNGVNGHLASIGDAAENEFVWRKYARLTGSVMLGGSDAAVEGMWTWTDGSPFVYANWAQGEPNDYNGEDYLTLKADKSWNDVPGPSGPYVCEWDK
jgi:hypothetical protein